MQYLIGKKARNLNSDLSDSKALNYLSHSTALSLNILISGKKKSIILYICPACFIELLCEVK